MSLNNTTNDERKVRYQKARAGFVIQGTTSYAMVQYNKLHIQNVRDAFLGKWNGQKAQQLITRVESAALDCHK